MSSQEVLDIAWDSARRTFKAAGVQPSNQTVHHICGQAIELVLKASVASRTLDNITGVLVSFKNFRKTLKNELAGIEKPKWPDAYRQTTLNQLLSLPNGDLTWEDVEKPDSASRYEVSVDNMAKIPNSSSAPAGRLNSS